MRGLCSSFFLITALILQSNVSRASVLLVTAQGFDGRENVSDTSVVGQIDGLLFTRGYGAGLVNDQPMNVARQVDIMGEQAAYSETVNSNFQVRLSFSIQGSTTPLSDQPSILVEGHVTGGFYSPAGQWNITGGIFGSGSIVEFSQWTPNSGISQAVLDQIASLTQFNVESGVTGGGDNIYGAELVAMPTPTPEPSTLVLFASITMIGGFARSVGWFAHRASGGAAPPAA